MSQNYVTVKPSDLPAATTVNPTDLFILNQGTTTKKVTYTVVNTVLKDIFATNSKVNDSISILRDSINALRSDIGTGGVLVVT